MTPNLWNTQSPIKRIDLCFKIDKYRKHLISLQNVKSTFVKTHPQSFLPKNHHLNSTIHSPNHPKKPISHLSRFKSSPTIQNQTSNNFTVRQANGRTESPLTHSRMADSRLNFSKLNSTAYSPVESPKKIVNFREWQIKENNKIILKKLQQVKASLEVSKKRLAQKYSMSDMKYKINLQKTRYKNVDFTKAAEKLMKGQKLKFSQIRMSGEANEGTEVKKIKEMNLNWKMSKINIPSPLTENVNLIKELR